MVVLQTDADGHPQFARMKVIDRVTIAEIHRVAQEVIATGSTIISDGHISYKRLPELGYQHATQDFNKSDPDVFLKWVHVLIGNAKAFIDGTYHGLGTRFMQSYLDEFCYRFNRRQHPKRFVREIAQFLCFCVSSQGILSRVHNQNVCSCVKFTTQPPLFKENLREWICVYCFKPGLVLLVCF